MLADIQLAPGVAPLDPLTIERLRRRAGELGADLVIVGPSEDPAELGCQYLRRGRPFVRIRRITGYLVGDLGRWNSAKRAEERDRVKHAAP